MLRLLKGLGVASLLAGGVYYYEKRQAQQHTKAEEETNFEYKQADIFEKVAQAVPEEKTVAQSQVSSKTETPEVVEHKPETQQMPPAYDRPQAGKFVCQLYPMNKSKVRGTARINGTIITSMDCVNPTATPLSVHLYEYGGRNADNADLTEGELVLGRRLVSLGEVSTDFQQNLSKEIIFSEDILGRSLVLKNDSGQMVAAGVIAWASA